MQETYLKGDSRTGETWPRGCPLATVEFDVAAKALEFFCAPNWKGPRPARSWK